MAAAAAERIGPFASGHSQAQRAILLLRFGIALAIFAIASGLLDLQLLGRYAAGQPVSQAEWDGVNLRIGALSFSQFAVQVLTAVFFLIWFYRAYRNLPALGARGLGWTPARAVITFFVPFVNLYRPFQAMREIWRASDPAVDDWHRARSSPLLPLWWLSWMVSDLLCAVGGQTWDDPASSTVDDMRSIAWVGIAGAALSIAAALLAVQVIRAIDARQQARADRMAAESASQGDAAAPVA